MNVQKLNKIETEFLCSILNKMECAGPVAQPDTLKYFIPEFAIRSVKEAKMQMTRLGHNVADAIIEKIKE